MCSGTLVVEDPERLLLGYIAPDGGYAYPAYDRLVTNGSVDLVDGDLLAPILLNAHVDSARFAALCRMWSTLSGVSHLPRVALEEADDQALDAVAALFAPLDEIAFRSAGVRGTIVAKVLHRKRPDLVPLYDRRTYEAYTATGVIPVDPDRSWHEFMRLFCRQLRADLQAESGRFAELQGLAAAQGAHLSRLRILDILVWRTITDRQ